MFTFKFGAAAVALSAVLIAPGCAGKAPVPLAFNSRSAEDTFRWLANLSQFVRIAQESADREQSNNPLRKAAYATNQEARKSWDDLATRMVGRKVDWSVTVKRITREAVEVDCVPKPFKEDDVKVEAMFAEYPAGTSDHFDGRLVIGQSILMEQAKRLNVGSDLSVQGVIENVKSSISNLRSPGYILIYRNQTKAILP